MSEHARRVRFEQLAGAVHEPLQRYLRRRCRPDDVDDVLNDVLLVLWRRLDDAPDDPLPWTYGVARRCLANHRRTSIRRLRLTERVGASLPAPPGVAWATETDVRLDDALAALTDRDRELIRLWAWERLEPRQIAEVVESSPNAVSLRLTRLRRRLRAELDRQDGADAGHNRNEGHQETRP